MTDLLPTNIAFNAPRTEPLHYQMHNAIHAAMKASAWNVVTVNDAAGDGTTDDTDAVQDAIDAVATAGGGIVYFPAGTYICSTLTWKTGVFGVGAGVTASIIKLKAGTDDDLIKGENFATLTVGDTIAGIHDFGFRDIALDGNKANNAATSYVVRYYGYRPFFSNVDIRNGNDGGLYSQSFTDVEPVNTLSTPGDFYNVHFHDNGGNGLHFNGPHDSVFTNCWFFFNTGKGAYVAARGDGTKFVECHSYGNDQTHALHAEDATGVQIMGGMYEGASTAQIVLESASAAAGASSSVRGALIFAAGASAPVGIVIDGPGSVTIQNNRIEDCTSGAIVPTSDGGNCTISDNDISATSGNAWGGSSFATTTYGRNNRVTGGMTGGDGSTATITAGGAITLPIGADLVRVATAGGASTDDLDSIGIRPVGTKVTLFALDNDDDVVVRDEDTSAGNIQLSSAGAFTMSTFYHNITLICDGVRWFELSRMAP